MRYSALITMTIVDEETGQPACPEQNVFVQFDPPGDPRDTLTKKALLHAVCAVADSEAYFKTL